MPYKPGRPPISETVRQDIIRRRKNGESYVAIGKVHDLSPSTVRKYCVEAERDDAIRAAPAAVLSAAEVKDLQALVHLLPRLQFAAQLGSEEQVRRLRAVPPVCLTAEETSEARDLLRTLRTTAGSVMAGAQAVAKLLVCGAADFFKILRDSKQDGGRPVGTGILGAFLLDMFNSTDIVACANCKNQILSFQSVTDVRCPACQKVVLAKR